MFIQLSDLNPQPPGGQGKRDIEWGRKITQSCPWISLQITNLVHYGWFLVVFLSEVKYISSSADTSFPPIYPKPLLLAWGGGLSPSCTTLCLLYDSGRVKEGIHSVSQLVSNYVQLFPCFLSSGRPGSGALGTVGWLTNLFRRQDTKVSMSHSLQGGWSWPSAHGKEKC